MRKIFLCILLFLFINSSIISVVNSVSAVELVGDYWNAKAPMAQPRHGLGVVALDGKIYAIGGLTSGDAAIGTNECYNPKTDSWITLRSMLTPRARFAIAACQGKIYCIGGITYDNKLERVIWDTNEVYDPATNSWNTKAPLPYAGTTVQANVVDDKIFVIINGKDLYLYDPNNDTWTKKADLPETPVGGALFTSVAVNGKIMVTGDFSVDDPPNRYHYQKALLYDSKIDRWSEGKTGPAIVEFCVAGATTGTYAPPKVYVLGLIYDSLYSVEMVNQVYDPVSDMWSSAKVLPTDRLDFGVAVVNDILYVIGGYTSNDLASIGGSTVPSALNEQYTPLDYTGILDVSSDGNIVDNTLSSETTSPVSLNFGMIALIALVLTTIIIVSIAITLVVKRRNK